MTYRYEESGLGNVILLNGFARHATAYGETVAVDDVEGLHEIIAASLVRQAAPLNGAELRFLRRQLEVSQKSLAQMIGVEEQALARWEKARDRDISGMADRLVRLLYREHAEGSASLRDMIARLAATEASRHRDLRLMESGGRWVMEKEAA